jgi:hypothetical protein
MRDGGNGHRYVGVGTYKYRWHRLMFQKRIKKHGYAMLYIQLLHNSVVIIRWIKYKKQISANKKTAI